MVLVFTHWSACVHKQTNGSILKNYISIKVNLLTAFIRLFSYLLCLINNYLANFEKIVQFKLVTPKVKEI
jgi:hypothetical protein